MQQHPDHWSQGEDLFKEEECGPIYETGEKEFERCDQKCPPPQGDITLLFNDVYAPSTRKRTTNLWEAMNDNQNTKLGMFLSDRNLQTVQNGIRAMVYSMSKNQYIMAEVDKNTLYGIMQSFYHSYPKQHIPDISEINKVVVYSCANDAYAAAKEHIVYQEESRPSRHAGTTSFEPLQYPTNPVEEQMHKPITVSIHGGREDDVWA